MSQEAFITNINFNFEMHINILYLSPKIKKGKKKKKKSTAFLSPAVCQESAKCLKMYILGRLIWASFYALNHTKVQRC